MRLLFLQLRRIFLIILIIIIIPRTLVSIARCSRRSCNQHKESFFLILVPHHVMEVIVC